jgi:hypothetical protein
MRSGMQRIKNRTIHNKSMAFGNAVAVVSSISLAVLSAAYGYFSWLSKQPGESGTEYFGLALFPYWFASLLVVLGGLLATALRRQPLPIRDRRLRLTVSVIGLAVLLFSRLA